MALTEMIAKLQASKLVAVIRGNSAEEAQSIAEAAIKGGITHIELTYTTPFVGKAFEALHSTDATIGAGTVLDVQTARDAILHGAQFVVSPHFDSEIAKLCNRYNVLYMPGCMTVKEIVSALEYGCTIVKLFPANGFDPSFIKSIKGPIPQVDVMPTGGINLENMKDWIQAGAAAVGIGSDLTKAYRMNGAEGVTALAQDYTSTLRRVTE